MAETSPTRIERATAALRTELQSCGGTESNSYLLEWGKTQGFNSTVLRCALIQLGCRCFWSENTASERPKKFWSLP